MIMRTTLFNFNLVRSFIEMAMTRVTAGIQGNGNGNFQLLYCDSYKLRSFFFFFSLCADNTNRIIGASIGSIVGILIIVLIVVTVIVYCMFKKLKGK